MRAFFSSLFLACVIPVACGSTPTVSDHPTWADVEPILRGACTHCHGATAAQTGSSGPLVYRFDFYDMTAATCGDAAQALSGQGLGHDWAALIKADVTSPGSGWRPRMPPAPASELTDWQRETIVRWASEPDPLKGEPQRDNHRPDIQLGGDSSVANARLAFTAVISDPDNESVVGVLKIGDVSLKMDRPGAFAATLDTSAWPAGLYPISATICDGWDSVTYDRLGNVQIRH
jgi:hypothetical protein